MDKVEECFVEQIIAQNKALNKYTMKAVEDARRTLNAVGQLNPEIDIIFRDLRNRHSKSFWRF